MTAESREALRRLVATLEEHLEAVISRRSDTDVAVDNAYESVAVAFERYEAELDANFAETLPMILDEDDELDDEDDELDDDDDDDDEFDDDLDDDDDDADDDIEEFDLR